MALPPTYGGEVFNAVLLSFLLIIDLDHHNAQLIKIVVNLL